MLKLFALCLPPARGIVRGSGGMDQSGHKSDPGDTRACDNEQCAAERHTQRLQYLDAQH